MSSLLRKFMAVFIASSIVPSLIAATADAPVGQWSGNSQIDGDRAIAKTMLSLGAPDGDDSTLRIQGNSDCTLKRGSYSADNAGGWALSFKQPMGGDVCTRLAKGTFVLRSGTSAKQLQFDVKYPSADGGETQRHGTLNRYP